jgi:hypothetical protein
LPETVPAIPPQTDWVSGLILFNEIFFFIIYYLIKIELYVLEWHSFL